MVFVDKNLNADKIVKAIGTGGILIVAGDLFCSPFVLSSSLRRAYNDLATACKIHRSVTDTTNQFIEGEKAQYWLINKEYEATKRRNLCVNNENSEKILFYFGNILIALGFSFLLLVLASEAFYKLVSSVQSNLTIISFIFLMVVMIIKDQGEYSLEEVFQNKEHVTKITRLQLQQKHQKSEYKK
jgi:hypothetical protein